MKKVAARTKEKKSNKNHHVNKELVTLEELHAHNQLAMDTDIEINIIKRYNLRVLRQRRANSFSFRIY